MAVETINLRIDTARKVKLQAAADLSNRTLTAFILTAADAAADEILADNQSTQMTAQFFDDFFDAVAAAPSPALTDAAQRLPPVIRRG